MNARRMSRLARNALYFALGIVLALFALRPGASWALEVQPQFWGTVNGLYYTGSTAGNITTYTMSANGLTPVASGAGSSWSAPSSSMSAATWSNQAVGGAVASRNVALSAGGASATLTQRIKVAAAPLATQVAKVAKGQLPILAASSVASVLLPYGLTWLSDQQKYVKAGFASQIARPFAYRASGGPARSTPLQAAIDGGCSGGVCSPPRWSFGTCTQNEAPSSLFPDGKYQCQRFDNNSGGALFLVGVNSEYDACPTGYTAAGSYPTAVCNFTGQQTQVDATAADIDTAASQLASGGSAAAAAQVVSQAPFELPASTPSEIDLPAPVQTTGKTTTTTDAAGNVTNTTSYQTISFTSAGDNITNQTFSTTTNNVTTTTVNGTPTSTTTAPADPTQEPPTFTDSAFPAITTLYERKYPDGLLGVWNAHKTDLLGTSFITAISSFFNFSASGSCPQWGMSFGIFQGVNLGSHNFDIPCWIYTAIGLMMLLTATFTARAIIFGG